MSNIRLVPRLDIKGKNLIKSIQFEGLRVLGDPHSYAMRYYEEGADELIYMDAVASLYGRNNLTEIIQSVADKIFIPITVGGGIRSVDDVYQLLRSGADKVAINTAAVKRPELIYEVSQRFGSQATVLSIEAKQVAAGVWEAYTDCGRERTNLDVIDWAVAAVKLGAGEILVTSVDREGTRRGFDVDLMKKVCEAVNVPVIASGGMGTVRDFCDVAVTEGIGAVAIADALHYKRFSLEEIRSASRNFGLAVREL